MRAPDFWQPGATAAIGHLLSPLGAAYAAATAFRASWAPQWAAPVPVICIGNLVMGGAGKTLVGLNLIRHLLAARHTPHVIMRGYGGTVTGSTRVDTTSHSHRDVGDEALLYGELVDTWVGEDRVESARLAVNAGASVIVMDDGFQNPKLKKTLSLLVFDGSYGVGNGYAFPAGPMREFLGSGIARADAIISIGQLPQMIQSAASEKPVFVADTIPAGESASLKGKRVLAFAGIGRPQKFFDSLAATGATVVQSVPFPDHHDFSAAEISNLKKEADIKTATLVTTTKDHVRLPTEAQAFVTPFHVDIKWQNEPALLDLVMQTLKPGAAHA